MRQTFVNYDANHRHTTERDLSMINTHISAHVATQANRHSQDGTETRVPKTLAGQGQNMLAVPPLGPQIGGLRTDSFSVLPIKSTCYTSLALDYCGCFIALFFTQQLSSIAFRYSNLCTNRESDRQHQRSSISNNYVTLSGRCYVVRITSIIDANDAEPPNTSV
jgi:hypothetical protein